MKQRLEIQEAKSPGGDGVLTRVAFVQLSPLSLSKVEILFAPRTPDLSRRSYS